MKLKYMAMGMTLGLAACTLQAQQPMPDMPGMKMDPPKSTPQQTPPTKSPTGVPKPNRTPQPDDPMPGDMKGMGKDVGDAKAKAAAASVEQSVQQQAGLPQTKPASDSDASSLKVPIQELQEPEALEFRTGSDLPAPELLGDVVKREPMTLEQFLTLADKANPTLAQAEDNVDRSRQQARQIGLPPDPIVGYSGDHIRGGEYHGGEQGAFFTQEFVLGRKLALRRDIYRAEGKSNEYALEVQRARVHNDVARAFFDALAAQQ
jgi:hypothetical protein